MDFYNFSGYGFDLGDLDQLTKTQQQTLDNILNGENEDGEDFINLVDDINDNQEINNPCVIDTPCNSEDFTAFVNLPDSSVVQLSKAPIKTYTIDEANSEINTYISFIFHKIGKEFGINEQKIDDLLDAIQPQIQKLAGHYEFQDFC